MKKRQDVEKENTERWLLTYADMITLLMLFFIVLYSLSSVDTGKYRQISQALESILSGGNWGIFEDRAMPGQGGILPGGRGIMDNSGQFPTEKGKSIKKRPHMERIRATLRQDIKAGKVSVISNEVGTVITLSSDVYFEEGSANLTPDAKAVLEKVGPILMDTDNDIRVEGHTDNRPIERISTRYRSNWELSSARALNVLEYFVDYGIDQKRISMVAFGSSRPQVPNDTPEDRALNRRVDIVIVNKEK